VNGREEHACLGYEGEKRLSGISYPEMFEMASPSAGAVELIYIDNHVSIERG
jgi:hypothetical protein